MARVLVLENDGAGRSFAQGALQSAGHEVEVGSGDDLAQAGGFDVLVADLHLGVRAGWFRPGTLPLDAGCPIVVTSPFAGFLASIADRVAATVLTPARPEALQRAVEEALAHHVTPAPQPADSWGDPAREALVAELTAPDSELNAIADLVARGIGTSVGLVTIVTAEAQHFVGQVGLPADLADAGGTPRSWSFCQHAVSAGAPLLVEDSRDHPLLARTPLSEMGLVRSYAGVPIDVDGTTVGTVCAMSDAPRVFGPRDVATLQLAARLVSSHLSRHAQARLVKALLPVVSDAPPPSRALASMGSDAPAIGEMLDSKYWITTRLGGGSLSEVLLARDRMLGQLVAIKVMRTRQAESRATAKRKMRSGDEDLLREATALAKVRHPNIVQVQGWGRTKRGQIYLVLEYVEGRTLEDRLAAAASGAEPLEVRYALQIVRQLGGALATLHASGIIHGDVKPENVMLDLSLDRAVLIDFGLALGGEDRGGTPGYSAPEQFALDISLLPTPALDVYALGAVAYAMLVGQAPFGWARGLTRVSAQQRGALTAPSIAQPGLPRSVDAVLLRALASDPAQRFDSVLGFTHALEEAIAGIPGGSLSAGRATEVGTPSSRGSTFRRLRTELQRRMGLEAEETLVEALAPADRDILRSAVDERAWYPTSALVSYVSGATNGDLAIIEDLAIATTTEILPELLKSAGVTRTPATLIHIAAPLVYRFHDWGKIAVVRSGSHDATLTLAMPDGYAPIMCRFITGALIALMRTASSSPHVTEELCMVEGYGACELKVTWAA